MLKTSLHRGIFIFFLSTLCMGLTLGKIIMSISMIGLFVNWFFEGNFKEKKKINNIRGYVPIILSGVFLLELLWMVFTKDYSSGLSSLRTKLPLLVLPLVIGTSNTINKKELKIIITSFLIGAIISSFIAYLVDGGWLNKKTNSGTSRDISITMSHIRYSVILCFSILIILHLMIKKQIKKWIAIILSIWLLFLIYKMASLTAIIGFTMGLVSYTFYWFKQAQTKYQKRIFYVLVSAFLILFLSVFSVINDFYTIKNQLSFEELPEKSDFGEEYIHDKHNEALENGYYIWRYIAETEIQSAWTKRSDIAFGGLDKKSQKIKFTLYRYLTSKGLKKDKTGIEQLSDNEIRLIEKGATSAIYYNALSLRIREVLFEWENYKTTKNPNNHSFTQRIFFVKIGLEIIKNAPIFGHGCGAVKKQYANYYTQNKTLIKLDNQLLAHNQFLTQTINLGIFGALIWIFLLMIPLIRLKTDYQPLLNAFSLMMLVAFFSDDMLERQAGLTIFATIYYLFIFTSSNLELKKLFLLKKNTE